MIWDYALPQPSAFVHLPHITSHLLKSLLSFFFWHLLLCCFPSLLSPPLLLLIYPYLYIAISPFLSLHDRVSAIPSPNTNRNVAPIVFQGLIQRHFLSYGWTCYTEAMESLSQVLNSQRQQELTILVLYNIGHHEDTAHFLRGSFQALTLILPAIEHHELAHSTTFGPHQLRNAPTT
jgi:hypothetical protein